MLPIIYKTAFGIMTKAVFVINSDILMPMRESLPTLCFYKRFLSILSCLIFDNHPKYTFSPFIIMRK